MPDSSAHAHRRPDAHNHAADAMGSDAALADLLDLDAEVLHAYWADVLSSVRRAAGRDVRRAVDLGSGTGTGTIGLAQRFAGAEVVAVDASATMLQRVRDKALDLGLAGRVRTVTADLDRGLPALGPVDLIWASMSLHHVTEPDGLLAEVFEATRPGGLVAVVEIGAPLRFLPDAGGWAALEARCLDALAEEQAHALPHLGSDWAARLAKAGLAVVDERTVAIAVDPPSTSATARYAHLWLTRLSAGIGPGLPAADRDALAALIDGGPESLRHRTDLVIRGTRTLTLARR